MKGQPQYQSSSIRRLMLMLCLGVMAGCSTAHGPKPTREERALNKKLDAIIIPVVSFDDVTLGEAADTLVAQSIVLDPDHEGIVVSFPYPEERDCPLLDAIHYENLSLKKALQVVGVFSGLGYGVNGGVYVFAGCHMSLGPMSTQAFHIDGSNLAYYVQEVLDDDGPSTESVTRLFKSLGTEWPSGTTLDYDSAHQILVVTAYDMEMCSMSHLITEINQSRVLPILVTHDSTPSIATNGVYNLHRVTDTLYRSAQPTAAGMTNLQAMGIKTVVNLRSFHSDKDELAGTDLAYEHIYMKAWHPEQEDVVRFLKIVTDTNRTPVLVHCKYGSDRSGTMCAVYRVVVQGWTKEDAVKEMTEGDFGFHEVWQNLPSWIADLDIEAIRRDVGITNAPNRAH